jgi:DNA-binding response OmpR family regulator
MSNPSCLFASGQEADGPKNSLGIETSKTEPLPSVRILLVEDDYIVATEAETALTEAGFIVLGPANSAAQAVGLAMNERPDIVVMDIRLNGSRDGVDAAREILEKTGIRSIFATAHTTAEIKTRAAGVRPLDWLPKPYSRESLVATVRGALIRAGRGD